MANREHVKLLKQGSMVWNAWREEHSGILPALNDAALKGADLRNAHLMGADLSRAYFINADLSGADLRGADLRNAHLSGAHLRGVDFRGANLRGADLRDADLSGFHLGRFPLRDVRLRSADLRSANLRGANLSCVNLSGTHLNDADLSSADLSGADLSGADLSGAHFQRVRLWSTVFAWVDLRRVEGLDTVVHQGPSSVDVKTVDLPEGETRLHFLRGTGFSDAFIESLAVLLTVAIPCSSCFISYAHQDETVARRLYKDLQDKGVRCWFAPHDLRPGTYHRRGIEDAIPVHQKVLLLLSEHAVQSHWVGHEVEIALNREVTERHDLLFPLRLDEAVMQTKEVWAARLRESRHIGDFTHWQDDTIYQQRFMELLRNLKVKTKL